MSLILLAAMVIRLEHFLSLVDAYVAATGLAEATVSARVMKDGKRLKAIRGGKDIGVRRMDEAIEWFSDNWPKGAPWPVDIPRPERVIPQPAEQSA